MSIKEIPSIVELMDDGVKKEIENEAQIWNTRSWKGTPYDRFPLSPSQIGKCGLALARNLAHYLGVASYPRSQDFLPARTKRIFDRGHLLEGALIADMERHGLEIQDQQRRVKLFDVEHGQTCIYPPERTGEERVKSQSIEGNIDGIVEVAGKRILIDYKSKGAHYSAAFTDSISGFFTKLRTTGLVEEFKPNAFLITDARAFFDTVPHSEFFIDYLLQLNAYAFAEGVKVDFVTLYYENKNTCAHYEVRWVPDAALFEYARVKFQYIFDTVLKSGPEAVPKEFGMGSVRCNLCEHKVRCYPESVRPVSTERRVGSLLPTLDTALRAAQREHHVVAKVEEEVLLHMERNNLTHIQTSDGLVYTRKFLKSPKEHYELRLSQ